MMESLFTAMDIISSILNSCEDPKENDVPTVYYVDGYHGGIRGHMPVGCWHDILNRMRDIPEWKVTLEIEPESWEYVKRRDPEAFRQIQKRCHPRR